MLKASRHSNSSPQLLIIIIIISIVCCYNSSDDDDRSDLRQVTSLLWGSVFSSVKWSQKYPDGLKELRDLMEICIRLVSKRCGFCFACHSVETKEGPEPCGPRLPPPSHRTTNASLVDVTRLWRGSAGKVGTRAPRTENSPV